MNNVANGGGHYRCPSCGRQYAPWVKSGGRCTANKLWMVELKDKSYEYVPIVWADTTVENLQTKFKLIMDPELQKMKDMKPEARYAYISNHLARTWEEKMRPLYMKHHHFTDHAKKVIDQKNSTKTEKPFDYLRVKEQGYHGKRVGEEVNLDEPLEQDDLLRMYGLTQVFLKALEAAPEARL